MLQPAKSRHIYYLNLASWLLSRSNAFSLKVSSFKCFTASYDDPMISISHFISWARQAECTALQWWWPPNPRNTKKGWPPPPQISVWQNPTTAVSQIEWVLSCKPWRSVPIEMQNCSLVNSFVNYRVNEDASPYYGPLSHWLVICKSFCARQHIFWIVSLSSSSRSSNVVFYVINLVTCNCNI